MAWKLSSPVEQRSEFIDRWLTKDHSVTELCGEFGISRKTAYKIINRFKMEGKNGLFDHSRRPHRHPATTSDEVAALICQMRGKHYGEGAVTLLERIRRKQPGPALPSASTAHVILHRAGLVIRKRPRRQRPHHALAMRTPSELYSPSPRQMPTRLDPMEY